MKGGKRRGLDVVGRMCVRRRKLVVAPLLLPLTVWVSVPAQPRGCRRCVDPGLGGGQGAAGGVEREGTNVAALAKVLAFVGASSVAAVALAPMVPRGRMLSFRVPCGVEYVERVRSRLEAWRGTSGNVEVRLKTQKQWAGCPLTKAISHRIEEGRRGIHVGHRLFACLLPLLTPPFYKPHT